MATDIQAMQAELAALKAQNAKLKAQAERKISLKVSAKKAMSLYGMGRFPVTLYKEQWKRVLGMAPAILAFLEAHDAELAGKDDATD